MAFWAGATRLVLRSRYIRPWLKRLVRSKLSPIQMRTLDCAFFINPTDNFTEYYLWLYGTFPEAKEISFLAELLQDSDATIIDVGANVGAFSVPIIKKAGPTAQLLAFEPNSTLLKRLNNNIALNAVKNITVFPYAIGETDKISSLVYGKVKNLGMGQIDEVFDGVVDQKVPHVQVRNLERILVQRGIKQVNLLKVDVEGFEDRVIIPLLDANPSIKPEYIYLEVAHADRWNTDLLAIMRQRGYRLFRDYGNNHLYRFE